MLVYREAAERFSTSEVLRSLQPAFRLLTAEPRNDAERRNQDGAVAALIRAGEFESALADLASAAAPVAARLTDAAASGVVGRCDAGANPLATLHQLEVGVQLPTHTAIRPLEGFAYYGLYPAQYVAMAADFLQIRRECRVAAVVGIRSIGAPLSAVVAAALRASAITADRITVRPAGHPTDRELKIDDTQARWIELQRGSGAEFLVVDEGPGRSGSSFLATAEALVRAGVEPQRITLLCRYAPDVAALVARDAPNRWQRFHSLWPAHNSRPLPGDADQDLSGGAWRDFFYADRDSWPSSWISTERLKFLSADRESILKFEGLGRYGDCAFQRSSRIAEAGFGPACTRDRFGFVRYAKVAGFPSRGGIDREIIHRLADYCAFRARAFATTAIDSAQLERMAGFNLQQILGARNEISLPVVHPVVADGRMMPHEWICTPSGVLLKTDAALHGDDHFYPGPADIAWDLAGAIVEWRMPPSAAGELLARYAAATHDDASARVAQYIAAYLAFRISFLEMAAASCDQAERTRLLRDAQQYRSVLARVISPASHVSHGSVVPHPFAQGA